MFFHLKQLLQKLQQQDFYAAPVSLDYSFLTINIQHHYDNRKVYEDFEYLFQLGNLLMKAAYLHLTIRLYASLVIRKPVSVKMILVEECCEFTEGLVERCYVLHEHRLRKHVTGNV